MSHRLDILERRHGAAAWFAMCFSLACSGVAPGTEAAEIPLGQATLVTAGTTYAVAGTHVTFTPEMFSPLDTPGGHVLIGRVVVTDQGATETLSLNASAVAPTPYPPVDWHGLSFLLSETGFVYQGHTATITVTRTP